MDLKSELKKIGDSPHKYAEKTPLKKLVLVLRALSHQYYNKPKPFVSDSVFDILVDGLKTRDPKNRFLTEPRAPIPKSKKKLKLPYWMGSLDKIESSVETLKKWALDYTGPYCVSEKLDGASALLFESDGWKMYSSGDGRSGFDISHLIPFIIDEKILTNSKIKNVGIRGELILKKKVFEKHLSDQYANGRNTVAGMVNSKSLKTEVASRVDFVAFTLYDGEKKRKMSAQFKLLKKWGFRVVDYFTMPKLDHERLSVELKKRRSSSAYEIDGLVVVDDKPYPINKGNPKHAFAFKMLLSDQRAETKVVEVEWNISMDARLVPVVVVEPVQLVGVTITHATAHNAKFVVDRTIGPGAVIEIIRSKDVIPYIQEVIEPAANGKPSLPKQKHKWNKTKVDLYLADPDEYDEVMVKQISHFFKTLEVKHISEKIVEKIVDLGYNTVPKLLNAIFKHRPKLEAVDGLGKKNLDRIEGEIREAFARIQTHELMAASKQFGRGFGRRRLKAIMTEMPDLITQKWTKKKLLERVLSLHGFEALTAQQFADNFARYQSFHRELEKVIDLSKVQKTGQSKSDLFKGEKIVFTGFRDRELKEFIESNGGTVTGSVSSKTTLVVYADDSGSKYQKARSLGVKTVSLDDFIEKYESKMG